MALYEIKNLNFAYSTDPMNDVIKDINLVIEKGSYNLICGRSGSGKTTLLKNLKPSLTPAGNRIGDILFNGKQLDKDDDLKFAGRIGYVMQDADAQIVTDVVWHELAFGLENMGLDSDTIRSRIAGVSSYFGIESWFDREVNTLSGGQKQILNLAAVMAMEPDVLILDEPSAQLDPVSATSFLDIIKKINSELATTIIISEHRLDEIMPCADRLIVMDEGRIIFDDRPDAVCERSYIEKNDMFAAMPVPAQIFYALKHNDDEGSILTVNDGKRWLEEKYKKNPDKELNENVPEYSKGDFEESKNNNDKNDVPVISAENIYFRYKKEGKDILKDLNLNIYDNMIYALVGGNGSGKTTLLKTLCGALMPYSGKIKLHGKDLKKKEKTYSKKDQSENLSSIKPCAKIAMLPQDVNALFVKSNVKEELLEMFGLSDENDLNEEDMDKYARMIDFCGIGNLLDDHPYDLSGGEQQRLALAKILLNEPDIILLDEPTKSVDILFKNKFAHLLKDLVQKGVTVFMVSHDLEFCAKHANKVGMMFDGQIISEGSPSKIFSNNNFYTTAAARMSKNIFKGTVTAEAVISAAEDKNKDQDNN